MSEAVVIEEWVGSNYEDWPVDFAAIEGAIARSGVPRASVELRLSLSWDGVYEDGDSPAPVLQLVRPETDAEREAREQGERDRLAKFAKWNADFLREYLKANLPPNATGPTAPTSPSLVLE